MPTHLVESLIMRPHQKHFAPCSGMNSYVQIVEDIECESAASSLRLNQSYLIEVGDDGRVPG